MNIPVRNLIFDLGGVILDLSVDHTLEAFANLSGLEKKHVVELFLTSSGFEQYEKGLMDDDAFRNYVRKVYTLQVSDLEIDACWNAMLLGISSDHLKLLTRLKAQYNVYLLSNTNTIHLNYINQYLLPEKGNGASLNTYFRKAYYSNEMKMRKPEPEIFQQVLEENNLSAGETLFLDDNPGNIEGAKAVGLHTVHVVTSDFILNYFDE